MERETGFEPATPSLEGSRSSQLSYSRLSAAISANPATRTSATGARHRPTDGGERRIRTSEGMSQQIYSLPPLAAWVSPRNRWSGVRRLELAEGIEPPTC